MEVIVRKNDFFFYVVFAVLVIAVIAVVIYKFIIRVPESEAFRIKEPENINLTDLDGRVLGLTSMLNKDKDTYWLFFELDNNQSLINRGLQVLRQMQANGKDCIATAVHDSIDEVRNWSTGNDFSPVYVIEDIDFYRSFYCGILPVIVKINKGKVKEYKHYIQNGGSE